MNSAMLSRRPALLFRQAAVLASSRRLASSSAAPKPNLVETSLTDKGGVQIIRFANEKKLNAWTMPLMKKFFETLQTAASDPDVGGVVVTGNGNYYSAGVDLSSLIKPMAPSKLVRDLRDKNELTFATFLNFPKPIVAAVNGPAIGAAVTSTILMDRLLCNESASFSLPFAKLGVPPEGCSSVTWAEKLGATNAERMLGPENWIPSGKEAFDAGLVDELVPGDADALVARAVEVCRERIAAGGGRRFDAAELERLLKVNADESAQLANDFVSPKFLNAMYEFNIKRKKSDLVRAFWFAKATLPLWQPQPILPSYAEQ